MRTPDVSSVRHHIVQHLGVASAAQVHLPDRMAICLCTHSSLFVRIHVAGFLLHYSTDCIAAYR